MNVSTFNMEMNDSYTDFGLGLIEFVEAIEQMEDFHEEEFEGEEDGHE